MKAFVITIESLPESQALAERCILSGAAVGVEVMKLYAVTPINITVMQQQEALNLTGFQDNRYSFHGPCVATFFSHHALWRSCIASEEPHLILEHDAIFIDPLPDMGGETGVCNLGRPSFGEYRKPPNGFGPFMSKAGGYLGGAHGYYVTPGGARLLAQKALDEAEPTDLFLNTKRFPWLTEYHPWPIVVDDSFSTIQNEIGCRAKTNEVTPLAWSEQGS